MRHRTDRVGGQGKHTKDGKDDDESASVPEEEADNGDVNDMVLYVGHKSKCTTALPSGQW